MRLLYFYYSIVLTSDVTKDYLNIQIKYLQNITIITIGALLSTVLMCIKLNKTNKITPQMYHRGHWVFWLRPFQTEL